MSWIELKLRIPEEILEKISAYLFAMGCEGMNVQKKSVVVYFSKLKWTNEISTAIQQYIGHFVPGFSTKFIRIKSIKDKNWMEIWRAGFKQLRLTYKIIIKPPWDNYKGVPGEIVVSIDPKMAFGTGHHESTQLIIENMEKLIGPETSVLDVGTGSGILAFLAEKLNAEKIMAIDNDPVAIKNAIENAKANDCTRLKLFNAPLELMEPEEFDLVLANINRNVLLNYAPYFKLFMRIKAKIILSGILLSDEITVTDTFQNNGFKPIKKFAKKDWLSIIFELVEKKKMNLQTKEFDMKKHLFLLILMLLVFIFACEEESNPADVGSNPVIEEITIRDKWNSASTLPNKIELKVSDPQGFSNISGVLVQVKNSSEQVVFSDSLYDDGAYYHTQDGDVFAGDGIFSNKFSSVQILSGSGDGDYDFSFQAFDKDNHESGNSERSVLFGPNARPEITNVLSPDTLNSGTSGQVFEISVKDDDGLDDISRVYFESQKDGSQTQIFEMDLFNDGNLNEHGDLFANDTIFTMKLDSTFAAGKIGRYIFHFYVEDSFNELNANDISANIQIENFTGIILSTSVPDSIEKPNTPGNTVPFELNAYVTDPQGLADIDSVYFLSEKPDGTFSGNGYHFELFDDGEQGNNGDDAENDGEYSLIIQIAESNDTGVYKFHFYMRDHVGHLTDVVKDSILVY